MPLSDQEREALKGEAERLAIISLVSRCLVESIAIGSSPDVILISELTGFPIHVVDDVLGDLYLALPPGRDGFTSGAKLRESHEEVDPDRALPDVLEFLSPGQES